MKSARGLERGLTAHSSVDTPHINEEGYHGKVLGKGV